MPNPATVAISVILNFNGVFETFSGEVGNGDPPEIILGPGGLSIFFSSLISLCLLYSTEYTVARL